MALTDTDTDELSKVYEWYDQNYSDFIRYLMSLDYDTRQLWLPFIHGVMLGNSIKEFFGRFDWKQQEKIELKDNDGNIIETIYIDGKFIEPVCGEPPRDVLLVCYHAKRLAPEVINNELPGSRKQAQEAFEKFKLDMLYGSDALSVIEYFESTL